MKLSDNAKIKKSKFSLHIHFKMVLGAGDEICNLNSAFICTEGENIVISLEMP
jgi:hypothetical protein